ncbi:DUF6691 family protein [Acidithiobacillus sp. AMEEHan]|uniref:DUF6691 family protein n=1 Tax=Acidithiobacillus sp. AMEEHan TaxID=2994951 RepID=UPI0027E4414F|nr:DUF6691 family protein [Acidithiobacillus sp. AMEEHan]
MSFSVLGTLPLWQRLGTCRYCPGPALASSATPKGKVMLFVAMIVGMFTHKLLKNGGFVSPLSTCPARS